ncbi:MAG: hypothetical protein D6715_06075 [Calditrichaeota bacterium]|nr:MAG: hypothetical protein D6715_06075 [Calditrichota bacterium]
MKVISRAPGKLILLGEYAVLEGAPALVTAVNRFARVVFFPSPDQSWRFSAPQLGIKDLPFHLEQGKAIRFFDSDPESLEKRRVLEAALNALAAKATRAIPPAAIQVDTSGFYLAGRGIKLGLGSSAAVGVALVAAGARWMHIPLNREEQFQMAWQAHRQAQQNVGSGIDVAASFAGGVLQYRLAGSAEHPSPEIQRLNWPSGQLYWLPVWTGSAASTPDMVSRFRHFARENPESFRRHLQALALASSQGCQALQETRVNQFLDAVKHFYLRLILLTEDSGIPIVSRVHRQVAQMVDHHGGVYKPSGAGGGDMGVAFFPNRIQQKAAAEMLKKAGYHTPELRMETSGVMTETFEA